MLLNNPTVWNTWPYSQGAFNIRDWRLYSTRQLETTKLKILMSTQQFFSRSQLLKFHAGKTQDNPSHCGAPITRVLRLYAALTTQIVLETMLLLTVLSRYKHHVCRNKLAD